jgi:signal transduction histidine kinase
MKEVSTRALSVWFAPLKDKGIALRDIVAGTDVAVATLRNRKERLYWSDFVAIMKNLRPYFSDAEFIDVGRSYFRSTGLQFAFVIARELFTPMEFYRWINRPRKGVGNQMFTCIVPTHRELSETELEVDLEVLEPHEVYWDFFIPTVGNFEEMPRLLGCPPATVRLVPIPRGARYHIGVPQRAPVLGRIRRTLTWPLTLQAAARELKDAHESLQERYGQLEDARGKLERQRGLLDTAYRIGQEIFGQRDPAQIACVVAERLVELPAIERALLVITGDTSEDESAAACVALPGVPSRGRLVVWPDSEDSRSLLALLAPTLALALDNAVAYRELDEYRRGLERLVEQRTAELRRASEHLAHTIEQLQNAQNARERFFGNISHEIRTPLSLILLATADIEVRAGDMLDPRGHANLGTVNDSARKLLRLVDELLLLAAGDAQALALRPETVDVAHLIARLGDTWRPAADAAGLVLAVEAPAGVVAAVDPIAFERMVTNLVSNAFKYTPRGGCVELVLEARGDRATIAVEVRDTGVGIDDELRGRLFDRFARARDAARAGGSGIGLSLVKQLAEAHGGRVTVEPRPGGGSVFRIELPAGDVGAPVRPDAQPPRFLPSDFGVATAGAGREPPPAPGMSAGSILVVDDDVRLAHMIADVLAGEYTVLVAHGGAAALELARIHQPHMLVTDVDMPAMDGLELARRFREITGDRLAPIVILSALADVRTRLAGLDAGAIDYVVKPFDPRELSARVRAQFRMRELAIRLHQAEQLGALGTLAAGLAHELRNPANGIVNALQPLRRLLPRDALSPEKPAGQLFEVVNTCADQVAYLSRQLLGFRSRDRAIEQRTVDLPELVRRAVFLAQDALRGIDVREHLDAGRIRCAPPLLVQVLTNLVENAGHAAGSGGWVEIGAHVQRGAIVVEVADSGPGVPVELRDRVFEPFFTTKHPGVGTGLGLPLARDIVHRHGGVLEIRERGERPVFVVELPQPLSEA